MVAPKMPPLLLIEDTPSLQMVYRSVLQTAGYEVRTAANAAEGLRAFHETGARVVLLDLMLPDRDGLHLMQDLLALRPGINIIVITANASINKAVEAMRAGAMTFWSSRSTRPVSSARSRTRRAAPATPARGRPLAAPARGGPDSGQMRPDGAGRHLHRQFRSDGPRAGQDRSVAPSMATVFHHRRKAAPEKSFCALAIHAGSPRATGPFIALNCGAIPQDLLESEVFGHIKGSFTGAISTSRVPRRRRMAARSFSTRSARWPRPCRPSSCAFSRPPPCNRRRHAPAQGERAHHLRHQPRSLGGPCAGANSARTSTTGFSWCRPHAPLRDGGEDVIEIAEAALPPLRPRGGPRLRRLSPEVRDLFLSPALPGNVRQVLNVMRKSWSA